MTRAALQKTERLIELLPLTRCVGKARNCPDLAACLRVVGCAVAAILVLAGDFAVAQDSLDRKLDRIEAKLDTLLALQRGRGGPALVSRGDTLRDSLHVRWGMVGPRGTVLDKRFFVINHNDRWKEPYWVAYRLTPADLAGEAMREDDFQPDLQLPTGSRSELADYRNSGYDRGHNAPAADFKRSAEAMTMTFLLSNMSPQSPQLNRGIWARLEAQVRDLAGRSVEVWVVTGNLFLAADSVPTQPTNTIGANQVAVPTHCFKVALSEQLDGSFRMYAFLLPNLSERLPGQPADYRLTPDRLEQVAGYDFFPDLPDDLESALEASRGDVWP